MIISWSSLYRQADSILCRDNTSELDDEGFLTLELEASLIDKLIVAAEQKNQTKEEFIHNIIKVSLEQ